MLLIFGIRPYTREELCTAGGPSSGVVLKDSHSTLNTPDGASVVVANSDPASNSGQEEAGQSRALHLAAPGEALLCLHPDGHLSVEVAASVDQLRAALAWLPSIRERHLTAARLTGQAQVAGAAPAGLRWPGQHRRAAAAELIYRDPAEIKSTQTDEVQRLRNQAVWLTLRWPAAPLTQRPPPRALTTPHSIPTSMLGWLTVPLPEALAAVVAHWQARGSAVQVQLSDSIRLHAAQHPSFDASLGRAESVVPEFPRAAPHPAGGPTLIQEADGTPIGSLWVQGGPQQGSEAEQQEQAAALQVLGLVAAQARAHCRAERRERAARLGSLLNSSLLALATHDAPLEAPLHSAMRLVGARGAALMAVQQPEPSSPDQLDQSSPGHSAKVFCPVRLGTVSQAELDCLLQRSWVRRLAAGQDPTPFVLGFGPLAGRQATLVVPLRAAGPLTGAWVFQCPYLPSHPNPEAWTALIEAAQHPAHLQSLLGDLPGSEADGHLTALSLLRSLGETDIPYTLAQRGLTHLTGRTGAQSGTYLTVQTTRGTEGGAGDLTSIVQVGQEPLTVPQSMLHSVANGGEQLLLSAPHPLLPTPLTSALLTPIRSSGRTTGVLVLLDTREGASPAPATPGLLALLAQRVGSAAERHVALRTLAHTREQAFRVLGKVLEYRSYETKGHTDRVTELALKLGLHLDLDFTQLTHLRWGAYLHDIGKIAIPDAVLLKRGPLTLREREMMHQHVTIGEQMLREQEFVPPEVLGVVRHHHERWDGLGYPDGLTQDQIPMLARLFAVVDVYDALTSERPYKKSWSQHDALFEMRRMAGTHLDPQILEQFEGVLRSIEEGVMFGSAGIRPLQQAVLPRPPRS
ncbi:MAG: hypothetical protein JWQ08_2520 [Deinococcus sp.]|nr:hypothetical protein [Deinococcus sp.]